MTLDPTLDHDRLCAGIVTQTDLLADHVTGAELTVDVPSCPGWNLVQLVRHVGAGHRWVDSIVADRATEPLPDAALRTLSAEADVDAARLAAWLTSGARRLADTLTAAGPDVALWVPVPDRTADFWARRFLHETAIHRADAALALGADFILDADVAADGVDEWLELLAIPQQLDADPTKRTLLGPGHTLLFVADDVDLAWRVDATAEAIRWSRDHADTAPAAVTVRAPLTELLLLLYRRRRPGPTVDVRGDAALLRLWLAHTAFG